MYVTHLFDSWCYISQLIQLYGSFSYANRDGFSARLDAGIIKFKKNSFFI